MDNSTDTNDNDEATNDPATEESEPIEKHKVAVIIKKEDEVVMMGHAEEILKGLNLTRDV